MPPCGIEYERKPGPKLSDMQPVLFRPEGEKGRKILVGCEFMEPHGVKGIRAIEIVIKLSLIHI